MKAFQLPIIIIVVASLVAFIIFAPGIGLNIDESPYILAGENYATWITKAVKCALFLDFDGVSDMLGRIDEYYDYNHEHPPLAKTIYGLFGLLFKGWLDKRLASRIGALFFLIVLQVSLYLLIQPRYGKLAACAAAAAILAHPRLLSHSFMCALDMPAASIAVLTALFFVRGLDSRRDAAICGIIFGLNLATKINGFFLIIPLMLWGYWFHREKLIDNLFFIAILSPISFIASWPWLWIDTLGRLLSYFEFHAKHIFEPVFYQGAVYESAPWHYAPVTTIVATPLVLVLAAGYAFKLLREKKVDDVFIYIVILLIFPMLVMMPSTVPIYNQMRLFLLTPVMLCGLAGIGLSLLFKRLTAAQKILPEKELIAGALIAVLLIPGILGVIVTHPYQLSYHSGIVGYRSGAVRLGFNLLGWAQLEPAVAKWIEQEFPQGLTINKDSGAATILDDYQQLGIIEKKYEFIYHNADYWIICANYAYSGFPRWWPLYYAVDPEYRIVKTFEHDGFPFVRLYKRENYGGR